MLGICYNNGDGVGKSYKKAFDYFAMAAMKGQADAQYYLARYYLTGRGVKCDIWKALNWFVKAAEQGHEEAECIINDIRENAEHG